MEQLPRLLVTRDPHTATPTIDLRSNPEPHFGIRKYASPNSIYGIACEELSILLKLPPKRLVPPLKMVFKSQRLRRSLSAAALCILLKRPSRDNHRLFDLLQLHTEPRKHSPQCFKPAMRIPVPPTTGLGIFLDQESPQFVAQKRRSVLNLPEQFGSCISFAEERILNGTAQRVNVCFLRKFGYTGRMHVESLPFHIPTQIYAQNVDDILPSGF
ncbi:hypothetical protein BWQ96_02805 [Gracilariopsis chorda]|uniref:Uncharacterized protein n=1 Tax=Gracilariopsis chorda TaxID=448386 RepID=A0A2V3IZA8_9FLOR|nr:hypothetical protein BWQ96_02805 [Gracilariopsis chorda]|eukprot:PXF47474.1 hypothetical protein BWQ96_02805 [Gracilariopsis chorda]